MGNKFNCQTIFYIFFYFIVKRVMDSYYSILLTLFSAFEKYNFKFKQSHFASHDDLEPNEM